MYRVGLSSSLSLELNEQTFASLSKGGIEAMEICIRKDEYFELDFKLMSELSKRYGIELWSYHLLGGDPSSLDEELRKDCVSLFSEMVKKASDIGIGRFIIHTSGERFDPSERQEKLNRAKESLSELSEVAAKCGSIICVENLPRTCLGNNSQEIRELISANDKLRVCFDTNHQLFESNSEFLKNLSGKIGTIHVSDYDFKNERHWLPGEGKLDWKCMFKDIKDAGYEGVWMYEMSCKCPKTIIRDRDLTPDDFVRNAKEIFEGKPLTIFSTPIDDLPGWQ